MKLSEIDENALNEELIDRLLFDIDRDALEKSDVILVLGSKKACVYRTPPAAELYFDKRAPKLLLSGGRVQNTPIGIMPEYLSMQKTALKAGVKKEDILTEKLSLNTAQNFIFSKKIIKQSLKDCKRITLVTAAFHMRRALLLGEKILDGYTLDAHFANDKSTRRDNWFMTEKGRKRCFDEARKIKELAKKGIIEDRVF